MLFCINDIVYVKEKPKPYAVVIGIGDYPNADFSLKLAKNDANAIYHRFKVQVGDI